jgi:hypothetical protein
MAVSGFQVKPLLDAMGLRGRKLKSVDIRIAVNELVTIKTVEFLDAAAIDGLRSVIETTYDLVERKPKKKEDE